jgi:hypothetical protein
MFNIYIYIYLFDFYSSKDFQYLISSHPSIFKPLIYKLNTEDELFSDAINNLLDTYTSIKPNSITLMNIDISKNKEDIIIYYTSKIPAGTKTVNCYNIRYQNCMNDPIARKALKYV